MIKGAQNKTRDAMNNFKNNNKRPSKSELRSEGGGSKSSLKSYNLSEEDIDRIRSSKQELTRQFNHLQLVSKIEHLEKQQKQILKQSKERKYSKFASDRLNGNLQKKKKKIASGATVYLDAAKRGNRKENKGKRKLDEGELNALGANKMQKMKAAKMVLSHYVNALLDPKNNISKIPEGSMPSVAIKMVSRKLMSTTNRWGLIQIGMGGIIEASPNPGSERQSCSLIPNIYQTVVGTYSQYCLGAYKLNYASTPTSLNLAGSGGVAGEFQNMFWDQWNDTKTTIPDAYSGARLVSFGFRIKIMNPLLTLGGVAVACYLPASDIPPDRDFSAQPFTMEELMANPLTTVIPLNKSMVICGRYAPTDNQNFEFVTIEPPGANPAFKALSSKEVPGAFVIYLDSEVADQTLNFTLEMYGNYEMLPREGTALPIDLVSSNRSDDYEKDFAQNVMTSVPLIYTMSSDDTSIVQNGYHNYAKPVIKNSFHPNVRTYSTLRDESSANHYGDNQTKNFASKISRTLNKVIDTANDLAPLIDRVMSVVDKI